MGDQSLGTDQLLPFERAESPADVNKSLLSALESELSDETEGESEPVAESGTPPDEAESEEEGSEEEDPEAEDDEPDEGEEQESEEDEEPEAEPRYQVKIDGKTHEVTLKEALDGYSRESDYRRKTQVLAEDRRKTEVEASELRGVRDRYAERLEAVALALKQMQPKEPDWDTLRKENPTEYAVQRADHQRWKEEAAAVEAEQMRTFEERLADRARQNEATLKAETERLHEAIPEWKDEAKAKIEKAKMVEYVTQTYGWTNDELANVTDHRLMLVLRKAMLYDEGQTKGRDKIRDKVKPAGQVLKPGNREIQPKRGRKIAAKRARHQLARSGRQEDAARYIETLLGDDG